LSLLDFERARVLWVAVNEQLFKTPVRIAVCMKLFTTLVKIVGQTCFLYGLLGWIYGVAFQFIFPQWLTLQLSHVTPWLRVDIFAIVSFFVSIFGFLVWRFIIEVTISS
jgi:hypothetical protein